jgi:GAF domain-containing protein
MSKSVRRQREPLSEEEIELLTQLANGNALARQRRRDRERADRQPPPDPS